MIINVHHDFSNEVAILDKLRRDHDKLKKRERLELIAKYLELKRKRLEALEPRRYKGAFPDISKGGTMVVLSLVFFL